MNNAIPTYSTPVIPRHNNSSKRLNKDNPANLSDDSSITFVKSVLAGEKYNAADIKKSINSVDAFIQTSARDFDPLNSTDNLMNASTHIKINLCMSMVLEATHMRINFPQEWQDIALGTHYYRLVKKECPEIENVPAFRDSIKYLIDNVTSPNVTKNIVTLKYQLEAFADHQDSNLGYIYFRKATGKPMTKAMQQIKTKLEHNIYTAADRIEKNIAIDQLIDQSKDPKLLQAIKQALQVKNNTLTLFMPSTRTIRLNRIENRIRDLIQSKNSLSG